MKPGWRVLQPKLQCSNVKPIYIETKGYNTDRKVPGVKVARLVFHRKKGSERQNGTMQKVPLSINNIQYRTIDGDRYIKNLTCTQVSSETLSHAVHKRATDIDPQQRHLQNSK